MQALRQRLYKSTAMLIEALVREILYHGVSFAFPMGVKVPPYFDIYIYVWRCQVRTYKAGSEMESPKR